MKTALLLASLVVFSSLGEIFSARGMKQVGDVEFRLTAILPTIWRAARNRSLWLAVVCLATSFFSFLSLLSYADLSYVIPLTAITYLTNTIGAKFFLKEQISSARWMGTLMVAVGVGVISLPKNFESVIVASVKNLFQFLAAELSPHGVMISTASPLTHWLIFSLRLSLLVCVLAAIVYYGISLIAGVLWSRDRRQQRALGTNFTPPISILIPVRGANETTYDSFASFCQQDYPDYQLIAGVCDERDPVIPVIRRLQRDFPQRQIDLVISDNQIGWNAKVSNLHNMSARIAHEHLVIVDSDIRVSRDYLRRVIAPLQQSHIGMVTCLYRGTNAATFASLLENIGISSTFSAEVASARFLEGVKFALGSTVATRRELLEKIGGFPAVANYLADDFLLGNYVAKLGYKVILSDVIVEHVSARDTFETMVDHQLRWGRSTRISRPKGYAGLILTYGTPTSLLLLAATGFSKFGWWMFALTMFIRLMTAWCFGVIALQDSTLARNFLLVPVRDLLGFGIWIMSFFGDTVQWRGARFRVFRDGTIQPATHRELQQSKQDSSIQPSAEI